MDNQRRLAIHESSHAVVGHALGKAFYGCAIFENSGISGGGTLTPPSSHEYKTEKLENLFQGDPLLELATDSVISAAGGTGEALATFSPLVQVSFGDRQLIDAAYKKAFPDCTDFDASRAWAALAVGRARSILSARWGAVEAVAAVLEKEGVCPAERVKQIMDDNP